MTERFDIEFMVKKGYVETPPGSGKWERPAKGSAPAQVTKAKRAHKYGAKSKNVDGIRYDSQREHEFKIMLDYNKIPYNMKEEFTLQPQFAYFDETIKAIKIIPDFTIYNKGIRIAVVDIKGMILPDFKIKMKMLKHKLCFDLKCPIPVFMPTGQDSMKKTIKKLLCLMPKKK